MGIADEMKKIADDIVIAHDLRVKAVGDIVADVHKTLNAAQKTVKGFTGDRKKMSAEQAKELTDFAAELAKSVGGLIKGFAKDRKAMAGELKETLAKAAKDIEKYVAAKLKEFSDSHAAMSEELKKELDKYVAGIASDVKKLLAGYTKDRKEVAAELGKMAANWQEGMKVLAKKKGAKPKGKAGASVKSVEEVIGR